jgi:FkbH-like protein
MKCMVISDTNLEVLKNHYLDIGSVKFEFNFSENLIIGLQNSNHLTDVDLIYIHADSFFKKYTQKYTAELLDAILKLAVENNLNILCSNIFSNGWDQYPMFESYGSHLGYIDQYYDTFTALKKTTNFSFLDVHSIIFKYGSENLYNFRLGHLYQMPYTKLFLTKFSEKLLSACKQWKGSEKKVIVLDCDNTLWRGIVGEDGIDGILCDLNSQGIVYYHFQQFLKLKKEQGFILAICSKNNESDVLQAFNEKRMPLNWNDFSIRKVNWNHKNDNIHEISRELNLGLDSFIFIDDSDFELQRIKDIYPEIRTIKMTNSYDNLSDIVNDNIFQKKFITDEDKRKAEQYFQESMRLDLLSSSISFDEYVTSLEIKIDIREDYLDDVVRASQLTEKTNQFNFNKVYYTPDYLREEIKNKRMKMFTLRVVDKFGDYGLTGVILLDYKNTHPEIENFIMSCRILGRKIENLFYGHVLRKIKEFTGLEEIKIRFTETKKNIPAMKFYNQIIKNEF